MLSSTAKNLYWLGRYLQRAESTARLLEATQRMALQSGAAEAGTAADIYGLREAFVARHPDGGLDHFVANVSALGENARSPVRFRFENDFMRANFEGAFAFRKGLQAEGGLGIESRSLRALLASFGIEVPTRGGFGAFSLKSRAH